MTHYYIDVDGPEGWEPYCHDGFSLDNARYAVDATGRDQWGRTAAQVAADVTYDSGREARITDDNGRVIAASYQD